MPWCTAVAQTSFERVRFVWICDSRLTPPSHQRYTTMATRQPSGSAVEPDVSALGITAAAGLILMLVGAFGIIQGVVGILDNDIYMVTNKWLFELKPTAWGWGHIVIGLVALSTGVGLFFGKVWAAVVAVIVSAFSILANFAWLPYYPIWAIIVIVFDLFVIWAVTAHGNDFRTRTDRANAPGVRDLCAIG